MHWAPTSKESLIKNEGFREEDLKKVFDPYVKKN